MPRFAILLVCCLMALGAHAAEYRNDAGRFAIWLPDPWVVTQQGNRILAHNPNDAVQVVAGPLKDTDADLVDEDVADFVDDEIDAMKVAADSQSRAGGFAARRLEGTGKDEGDDIVFHAVAIDPGGAAPVIEVLVYGEDDMMERDQVKNAVSHILNSFRPL